ncbi:MAG: TatD family hydrolase [Acutalibacteraceae bacterium]
MNLIFDTHAHYDDKAFDDDRENVIDMLFKNGVCGVVNQGTDIKTSEFGIKLAGQYDGFYAAVGLHPECLDENSISDLNKIRELAKSEKVVAIGEIGLDYYYDIPKDLQKTIFAKQLELAAELDMPINIHDREAHGDTLEMLKKYKPKGIVHCFSGSVEMAKEIVKLGMYIGIGGVVTFKNARKTVEVVENIPLERIVLETDCPYLSPVPFRGKRNDSSMIKYTAQRIAEIKNTTEEEILTITRKNAADVYNINM